jgi:biopolymer transport protein ExbB
MEMQFGLAHVWTQGDWVTRAVALILLGMSLASWMVILVKALDLREYQAQARQCEAFWHAADFESGLHALGGDGRSPFRQLALTGRNATLHLNPSDPIARRAPHLHDQLDVSDWVTRELRSAIDEFTARLQGGLAILASVGSTAPFVGLFGTVWGIYHALLGIGAAGQATIDKVAGPIGEALIMTALGLAVAIPAVLGYNALVRGNKGVLHKLNRFGHDLHALFVTGARVSQGGQAAGPAPAPAVVALRKP